MSKAKVKSESLPFDNVKPPLAKRYEVFTVAGEKFSSFIEPQKAVDWIMKELETFPPEDAQAIADANEATILSLPKLMQDQVHAAVSRAYGDGVKATATQNAVAAKSEAPEDDGRPAFLRRGKGNPATVTEGDRATGAQPDIDVKSIHEEEISAAFKRETKVIIDEKKKEKDDAQRAKAPAREAAREEEKAQIDIEDNKDVETPEHRFMRIVDRRGGRILKDIDLMKNCANKASYAYTEEQVSHVLAMFRAGIDELERVFRMANKAPKQYKMF